MQPLQSSQPSQSLQPDLSLTRPGTSLPRIIMLTVAAYRLLLALCPRELRHEYGTEMVQVLRQCCRDAYRRRRAWGVALLWLPTLGDVCLGAAAEYASLLLHTWKEIWFMNRIRTSAITVFCAYIGFVLAGIGFQKLSEYDDFTAAAQAHSAIGISFGIIFWGSAVALLAVLAGGLPLTFAALRYALNQRRFDIPLLFAVPVVAFAALLLYIKITVGLAAGTPSNTTTASAGLTGGLVAIMVLGAIASTAAVSLAITRSKLDSSLIAYTRIPTVITALVMTAMFLATLIWGLSLRSAVPQLFNSNEGLRSTSTAGTWLVIVIMMGIASIIAIAGAARSLTAPTAPQQLASA